MKDVWRSARLAGKPSILAIQKAQRNLYRKLGMGNDEKKTIVEVLREFIAMYQGPLPPNILATMTAIFDLDDDDTTALDDALLEHTREAIQDLQQAAV
jgi:hypothetical protein